MFLFQNTYLSNTSLMDSVNSDLRELSLADMRNNNTDEEILKSARRFTESMRDQDKTMEPDSSTSPKVRTERIPTIPDMPPSSLSCLNNSVEVSGHKKRGPMVSLTNLPLPHHYSVLVDMFNSMDTAISTIYKKNEKISFAQLQVLVENMYDNTKLTVKHLAQVKNIVPDFYTFDVKKALNTLTDAKCYDILITPNFPDVLNEMNNNVLSERYRYFYMCLFQLTKKHHSQFLQSLPQPITIPDHKLYQWHHEFNVDKLPELACSKLPTYSDTQGEHELLNYRALVEEALLKVFPPHIYGSRIRPTGMASTSGVRHTSPGMLHALREAQVKYQIRNKLRKKKFLLYNKLPRFSKVLRNLYVTERRNIMDFDLVLAKLSNILQTKAPILKKYVKILCEKLPTFVRLRCIRGKWYLRLDRNFNIKVVVTKLKEAAAKYRTV